MSSDNRLYFHILSLWLMIVLTTSAIASSISSNSNSSSSSSISSSSSSSSSSSISSGSSNVLQQPQHSSLKRNTVGEYVFNFIDINSKFIICDHIGNDGYGTTITFLKHFYPEVESV
uniref:Uncharacterized protein n=1 Tax=Glossina palpalis gambiensis TaxID=67801 RepID=A0A1B0AX92_9MUSC